MSSHMPIGVGTDIIKRANSLGASLAGIAGIDSLKNSPSYKVCNTVELPAGAKSILLLDLVHKETEPEMDWWGGKGGSAGNLKLEEISDNLKQWLKAEYNIAARSLPYHAENGGIFLKDAAVLAGLGTIGANNLLITPEYGPRVRLRALSLEVELVPTGQIDFAPCSTCDMPCHRACPQKAFATGSYSRAACSKQMQKDEANKVVFEHLEQDETQRAFIKYCRACELACPVGKSLFAIDTQAP